MPRINVVQYDEASGRLKEIYDDLIKSRGKLAEVHMIQSLRPESIVKHMDLYMEIMYSKSKLSRAEREMIAVVVSASNECEYCQVHHAEALNHYWKDETKVNQIRKDFRKAELSEKEYKLCEFAEILTIKPGSSKENDLTKNLKACGLSDEAILDATLVTAYFNFVNRIVLSLNIELEKDSGNYKY